MKMLYCSRNFKTCRKAVDSSKSRPITSSVSCVVIVMWRTHSSTSHRYMLVHSFVSHSVRSTSYAAHSLRQTLSPRLAPTLRQCVACVWYWTNSLLFKVLDDIADRNQDLTWRITLNVRPAVADPQPSSRSVTFSTWHMHPSIEQCVCCRFQSCRVSPTFSSSLALLM